jgi:plasmid maintenance system antidote protein VapI
LSFAVCALQEPAAGHTNRITEILNGRRAITGDTALRLAQFFLAQRLNFG